MPFTHLHVHSHYSLLDGLPKIDDLIAHAKKNNMDSLALTDHGAMYGVIEFYQRARDAGVKPILGVETYVARRTRFDRETGIDEKPFHLILLAENYTGYQNLIKLITRAHREGFYYKPRIDWELLETHHEGLIASSACLAGEVAQSILHKTGHETSAVIQRFQKIFGSENFFLEVQPLISPEQQKVNEAIFSLGKKLSVPIIATNDVHYLASEDAEAQDILLCIQTKHLQSDENRMSYLGQDLSCKSEATMRNSFPENPEVCDNTQLIAKRCNIELTFGKTLLPHFPLPKSVTPDDRLRELCAAELPKRYPDRHKDPALQKRMEFELETIKQTGFASYFLIVHDFVYWAKSNSIVVGPGRGSAAGSLVSYVLNITNVDPIAYELLFERFLNPERVSMPDIDLDFADTRRDEVIRYVEERYGKNRVAQIITFGTMAARAAVRDVGRVLGLPYSYCDRIAKLIPFQTSLPEAIKDVPELKEVMKDPEGNKLLTMAQKLEGVARHTSTHACGVLITPEDLDHYVPTQFAAADDQTVISQYSLHPIEDLGLLKMDFLGLRNLTVIEQTLEIIKKARNININIDAIPLDDAATFQLLQRGQTVGVFQLESSGMRRYLKELKPTTLEDIIAMVSLYRPGPIEFIPDFIAGKHGKKKLSYVHPKLEPILNKTHGIVVYQEQVMQIARDLAGFSFGQADILRKAVGKKIKKLLDEQKDKLIDGMVDHGIAKHIAGRIWEFIEPFARYGFNRAHAACYAIIAYQTAYLKTKYPNEFMAALMTGDHTDIDRIAIEVEEARSMGITVLPPDINESYTTFTAVFDPTTKSPQQKIRFGLLAIKNIGENIVRSIVHERKDKGPFTTLEDFLLRIHGKELNKKSLESLIKSGALDRFGERNQLLKNVDTMLSFAREEDRLANSTQTSLFASLPKSGPARLTLTSSPPASKQERLRWEKDLLGLFVTEHPVAKLAQSLGESFSTVAEVTATTGIVKHPLLVVVLTIKRIMTKTMEPMLFVKIEDHTGSMEAIVFPRVLQSTQIVWQEGNIVRVSGKMSEKNGESKFIVDTAKVITDTTSSIVITLPGTTTKALFEKIQHELQQHPGTHSVRFLVEKNGTKQVLASPFRVTVDDALKQKIQSLVGKDNCLLE